MSKNIIKRVYFSFNSANEAVVYDAETEEQLFCIDLKDLVEEYLENQDYEVE